MSSNAGSQHEVEFFGLVLRCLPAYVVAVDSELRFISIRGSGLETVGLDERSAQALLGTPAQKFVAGPPGKPLLHLAREALNGRSGSLEFEWNGRWFYAHVAPMRDGGDVIVGAVAVGLDVSRRHRLEEQLEKERNLLNDALDLAEVGSWVIDVPTGETHVSEQMARLLGIAYTRDPIDAGVLWDALRVNDMIAIEAEKQRVLSTCGSYEYDHDIIRPDGGIRHVRSRGHVECDAAGKPSRCVGTMLDITERVIAQRTAEMLAYHDPLTGLANRWLLRDRLAQAIATARREANRVFVAFIDLDNFKRINDSLGHAQGDVLLGEVGQRLYTTARGSDTVARVGGDEFVIVLTHIEDDKQLDAAVKKIRAAFKTPFRLAEKDCQVTASIGIAGFPDDALTHEQLLRDADIAMYDAKQLGRNRIRRFSGTSVASAMRRVELEVDLPRAMEHAEFRLYYQPVVEARTLRTVGIEALLRWDHPNRGLLLPETFLDAIEETEYAKPVGEWVIRTAIAQLAQWRRRYGLPLRMSANVSAGQLERNRFAAVLADALTTSEVDASAIDLELTENTLVRDLESASAVLTQVRGLGVGIAIDDFGTGYNSLTYLKHFPVTALKIDRSFVGEIGVDSFDEAVSSAVAAFGKALRIRVVAEGVENQAQMDMLRLLGCDELQGFYFAPPLEAAQLDRRLALEAAAG